MTELRENMTSIEPSLTYGDGLMMVHEEKILLQGFRSAQLLTTRAPVDLPAIFQ